MPELDSLEACRKLGDQTAEQRALATFLGYQERRMVHFPQGSSTSVTKARALRCLYAYVSFADKHH